MRARHGNMKRSSGSCRRWPAFDRAVDLVPEDQARKLELVRAIKSEVQDIQFAPIDQRPVDPHELDPTLWYLMGFLGLGADAAQARDPNLARQLRLLRESILQFRKV